MASQRLSLQARFLLMLSAQNPKFTGLEAWSKSAKHQCRQMLVVVVTPKSQCALPEDQACRKISGRTIRAFRQQGLFA